MKKAISLIKGQDGLSLLELIITMMIIVIVLTLNTSTLGVALKESRQQVQSSGAGMDKIAGLEVLRMDIEHAGYGLPWSFGSTAINYNEAAANPAALYNDSPSNPPAAVRSGNGTALNGSDYFVIKSTAVGTSMTALKWNYILSGNATVGTGSTGGSPNKFVTGERVTILWPKASGTLDKQLIMNGSAIYATMPDNIGTIPVNFRPTTASQSYVVYGVDPTSDLRMPFNRADYYIARPADMPQGCAPQTGVLYKATVNHADGSLTTTPLLDCVADLQIAYGLDTNNDGVVDAHSNDISALGQADIRQQVKEVRLYVLSHEGAMDKTFRFTNENLSTIRVGDAALGLGRDFNMSGVIGTDWQNYRWKLDSLVVRTRNILN